MSYSKDNQDVQRITCKSSRPNPLFESWLQDLYKEAFNKNSKLVPILKEALDSILKYPLPLRSGADCAILKGFGKKLCLFLDQQLEIHNKIQNNENCNHFCQANISADPVLSPETASGTHSRVTTELGSKNQDDQKTNQNISNKQKHYKPVYRSGGYAILVALYHYKNENPDSPGLNKEDLIEKAQDYSEESFTRPKPESFYTAWSNMTRLISKGLVNKTKKVKPLFYLTNEGSILVKELLKENKNRVSINDMIFHDTTFRIVNDEKKNNDNNNVDVDVNVETIKSNENLYDVLLEVEAGHSDVVLLIDKQETGGASKKNDPTVAQFKKYPDLKHEYRHLKVGDFTWIVRDKRNKDQELVLPFIVERKRMDDLGHSIKDGRFHEQKFRLRKCGIENVIYLVENYGSNKHIGLPLLSLMQALANTRVHDKFKVHITNSLGDTARFLAMMTKRLTIEYKDKCLIGRNSDPTNGELMIFSYFNKSSAKTKSLTVTETFMKLLLQLKGLSVEKALAITSVYNTPKALIEAYQDHDQESGEILLANLKYGEMGKNVGPIVSKAVYQLLSIKDLK